jgi:phosphatidylglycerol:prolipoprotein diacylglycerol transferase
MISNQTSYYLQNVTTIPGLDPARPVHPTFFYEFIANLAIFFVLLRYRKKSRLPYGTVLTYLLLYGFVRYFVEGIRTDPLFIPGTGIRASQLLSALMVVGSALALILLSRRQQKQDLRAALASDDESQKEEQDDLTRQTEVDFVALDDAAEKEELDRKEDQARQVEEEELGEE